MTNQTSLPKIQLEGIPGLSWLPQKESTMSNMGREANAIYSFALGKISSFIAPMTTTSISATQKSLGTKVVKNKRKIEPILYG
jgi:hypothetical protein